MHILSAWPPIMATEVIAGGFVSMYFVRKVWNKVSTFVFSFLESNKSTDTISTEEELTENQVQTHESSLHKDYFPTSAQKIHFAQMLQQSTSVPLPKLSDSLEELKKSLEELLKKFDQFLVPNVCIQEQTKVKNLFENCLQMTTDNLVLSSQPGYKPGYADDHFFEELNKSMQAINTAHALKKQLPPDWSENLRPHVHDVGDKYKLYFSVRKQESLYNSNAGQKEDLHRSFGLE